MLTLSENLINKPVLSLRTGGVVATTITPIFNPNNLKVEGFYCQDKLSKDRLILLYQDIRNIIAQGIVVNDHDVLAHPDVLVRLQNILKINFTLIGKDVITQDKTKVGKVKDFAVDSATMYVQKLYVGKPIMKSFNTAQLSVDRNQIVEITDTKIIIQDLLNTSRVGVPAAITP